MTAMTRRERRAERQRSFVADKEARLAARLARLDYKVTNESGALRTLTHSLTWHLGNRPNGPRPPDGRGWDKSGLAFVVGLIDPGFPKIVVHPSPMARTDGLCWVSAVLDSSGSERLG